MLNCRSSKFGFKKANFCNLYSTFSIPHLLFGNKTWLDPEPKLIPAPEPNLEIISVSAGSGSKNTIKQSCIILPEDKVERYGVFM